MKDFVARAKKSCENFDLIVKYLHFNLVMDIEGDLCPNRRVNWAVAFMKTCPCPI